MSIRLKTLWIKNRLENLSKKEIRVSLYKIQLETLHLRFLSAAIPKVIEI